MLPKAIGIDLGTTYLCPLLSSLLFLAHATYSFVNVGVLQNDCVEIMASDRESCRVFAIFIFHTFCVC